MKEGRWGWKLGKYFIDLFTDITRISDNVAFSERIVSG
jgi:hypothetical protein